METNGEEVIIKIKDEIMIQGIKWKFDSTRRTPHLW